MTGSRFTNLQIVTSNSVTRGQMAVFLTVTWGFTTAATPAGQKRVVLYTPGMNLATETEYTSAYHRAVLYEYVPFNGHPVAQVDSGTTTHWTFTDHLGTPTIQTKSDKTPYWQADYEPYGKVFGLRMANQHQPQRLPGQEAEELIARPLSASTPHAYRMRLTRTRVVGRTS